MCVCVHARTCFYSRLELNKTIELESHLTLKLGLNSKEGLLIILRKRNRE